MHTHLVTFQVVGRTPFDVEAYEEAYERPERRPRRASTRPRSRPARCSRPTRRARLQGHGQGEPRLLHDDPGEVRPADRRDRAAELRPPLPHRRARGQRHDAAVHRHTLRRRWLAYGIRTVDVPARDSHTLAGGPARRAARASVAMPARDTILRMSGFAGIGGAENHGGVPLSGQGFSAVHGKSDELRGDLARRRRPPRRRW